MNYIERAQIFRAVRDLARQRGHRGDLLALTVPSLGEREEEQAILWLRLDAARACRARGPEAELLIKRLARAAVLAEPWLGDQRPPSREPSSAVARENSAAAARRQRREVRP